MPLQDPRAHAPAGDGPTSLVVVVVDEDQDGRDIVATWLRARGLHAVSAADPDVARAALGGRRVDVVVCELRGLAPNAPSLARRVRAVPEFRDVPLIVHTSRVGATDREDAAACGASAFLAKPCGLGALLTAVHAAARPSVASLQQ